MSVVRSFLERRPDESLAEVLSPDLAEREEIVRALSKDTVLDYYVEIRRLELAGADDDAAVCICDARLRIERLADGQAFPHVGRLTIGPRVDLVHAENAWKISDYTRNGIPMRSTFRLYHDQSYSVGDFTVVPRLLQQQPQVVHLAFEFSNGSPTTATIVQAQLHAGHRLRLSPVVGVLRGASLLQPGARGLADAGWLVRSRRLPDPLGFEFVIASDIAEATHVSFYLRAITG